MDIQEDKLAMMDEIDEIPEGIFSLHDEPSSGDISDGVEKEETTSPVISPASISLFSLSDETTDSTISDLIEESNPLEEKTNPIEHPDEEIHLGLTPNSKDSHNKEKGNIEKFAFCKTFAANR